MYIELDVRAEGMGMSNDEAVVTGLSFVGEDVDAMEELVHRVDSRLDVEFPKGAAL